MKKVLLSSLLILALAVPFALIAEKACAEGGGPALVLGLLDGESGSKPADSGKKSDKSKPSKKKEEKKPVKKEEKPVKKEEKKAPGKAKPKAKAKTSAAPVKK
jgi:outer membrane biosynthesis protein TonB